MSNKRASATTSPARQIPAPKMEQASVPVRFSFQSGDKRSAVYTISKAGIRGFIFGS